VGLNACKHFRYGGETGLAVLAPYGFQETTSDDWVKAFLSIALGV